MLSQIYRLRQNMLPEYRDRLLLEDIDSEERLVELVNKIDDRKGLSSNTLRLESDFDRSGATVTFVDDRQVVGIY